MKSYASTALLVLLCSSGQLFAQDGNSLSSKDMAQRLAAEKSGRPDIGNHASVEDRNRVFWDKQQPSAEALAAMSTENLMDELTVSQLAGVMLVSRTSLSPDGGLSAYANRHRGVALLLKRPDAAAQVVAAYPRLAQAFRASASSGALTQNASASPHPGIQTTIHFQPMVLDALLGSDDLAGKMTHEERRAAIDVILTTLDARLGDRSAEAYPVTGVIDVLSATITLEKLLGLEKDARYQGWKSRWKETHPESHAAGAAPLTLGEAASLLKVLRPELYVPTKVTDATAKPLMQNDSKLADATLMADTLSGAAEMTEAAWMQSDAGQANPHGDIPEKYWTPRIKMLKPLRVYTHNVNVVVAQKSEGGIESGKYIYIMISSYIPMGPVDGFEFKSLGNSVYGYTRTLAAAK